MKKRNKKYCLYILFIILLLLPAIILFIYYIIILGGWNKFVFYLSKNQTLTYYSSIFTTASTVILSFLTYQYNKDNLRLQNEQYFLSKRIEHFPNLQLNYKVDKNGVIKYELKNESLNYAYSIKLIGKKKHIARDLVPNGIIRFDCVFGKKNNRSSDNEIYELDEKKYILEEKKGLPAGLAISFRDSLNNTITINYILKGEEYKALQPEYKEVNK